MQKTPWAKTGQAGPPGNGLNVQSHLRDLLMSDLGLPIQQAQEIADKFSQEVENAQWLETSRGTQFDRSSRSNDPRQLTQFPGNPELSDF